MQDFAYYTIQLGLYLAIFSCFRNTVFVLLLLYCPSLYLQNVLLFFIYLCGACIQTYESVAIIIVYILVYIFRIEVHPRWHWRRLTLYLSGLCCRVLNFAFHLISVFARYGCFMNNLVKVFVSVAFLCWATCMFLL